MGGMLELHRGLAGPERGTRRVRTGDSRGGAGDSGAGAGNSAAGAGDSRVVYPGRADHEDQAIAEVGLAAIKEAAGIQ